MTDVGQLLLRQLIIINEASSAAIELLGGVPAADTLPEPPACAHPLTQREDLTNLGEPDGSHWQCRVCGHEEAADV